MPTLETVAAAAILRRELPDLKVRVVNVVDLMRLQPDSEHPHGLPDQEFDALFTTAQPVIFAYHGYPLLIHRLTYRRSNHDNLHVRGYKEEGTTTTPFDMVMLNDLDRFHLVMDVIDRVPGLGERAALLRQQHDRRAPAPPRLHARARRGPARGDDWRWPVESRARAWTPATACASWWSTPARAASSWRCSTAMTPRCASASSTRPVPGSTPSELRQALDVGLGAADAVGHRIVHGGERFRERRARRRGGRATRCEQLVDLAPLHQPKSLAALDAVSAALPGLPAVACFDTAFHATLPAAAATYALPAQWRERWGLRRYGFHGLSHAWVARRAPRAARARRRRAAHRQLPPGRGRLAVRDRGRPFA